VVIGTRVTWLCVLCAWWLCTQPSRFSVVVRIFEGSNNFSAESNGIVNFGASQSIVCASGYRIGSGVFNVFFVRAGVLEATVRPRSATVSKLSSVFIARAVLREAALAIRVSLYRAL
jgi:hypothetical protein